jgi:hypothetical protein
MSFLVFSSLSIVPVPTQSLERQHRWLSAVCWSRRKPSTFDLKFSGFLSHGVRYILKKRSSKTACGPVRPAR